MQLQQSILPTSISTLVDRSVESIEALWTSLPTSAKPMEEVQHIQKAWDGLVAANHRALLLAGIISIWTQPDFLQHLLPTMLTGSMHRQ